MNNILILKPWAPIGSQGPLGQWYLGAHCKSNYESRLREKVEIKNKGSKQRLGRCCSGMIKIGNHLRDYEWIVLALCTRNRTWSPATVDAHVFLDCEPESEPARILLHPNLNPQKISRVRVHGIFVLLISGECWRTL